MAKGFAALALVAVLALGACGGDDSDEAGTDDGTTDTTEQDAGDATDETNGNDETSEPEAPGDGYTEQIRSNFMNACVAQPGATETNCGCTFDEISNAVPVEEFVAYDQARRQDPATPPPSWLVEAVTACG